ncbi:anhydro-N-acetylmuramic acid kinase [Legionella sp. CNM-4043-24]|uniref:anhydro-N-acetylmuramic acid kinase n=1 Tax=Legionella sp. CNM-4043-24 TaxID=3421646 RepID=UPI00403AC0F6
MSLFIGLMSGTSMDGIDAALVDMKKNICLYGITRPYSDEARQQLTRLLSGQDNGLGAISQLNTILGREFARAALQLLDESGQNPQDVVAIGSHGQTLCHDTSVAIPYTVQVGCAHTIAEMTGITVVADFRTRDLVLGGQGAPFAPLYHQAVFREQGYPLAVVNVGGIANISCLSSEDEVSGYDVGPGNCLMDAWIFRHLQKPYDKNGAWAASGRVIPSLLRQLQQDGYFSRPIPKSAGKEYFSLEWLEPYLDDAWSAADVQATLLQLTAWAIVSAVKALPTPPLQVLICGGGVHNQALCRSLSLQLPESGVKSTEAVQVNPDYLEAMMFAWFADNTLQNKALNLHGITGATRSAVLGAVYPAGIAVNNNSKRL